LLFQWAPHDKGASLQRRVHLWKAWAQGGCSLQPGEGPPHGAGVPTPSAPFSSEQPSQHSRFMSPGLAPAAALVLPALPSEVALTAPGRQWGTASDHDLGEIAGQFVPSSAFVGYPPHSQLRDQAMRHFRRRATGRSCQFVPGRAWRRRGACEQGSDGRGVMPFRGRRETLVLPWRLVQSCAEMLHLPRRAAPRRSEKFNRQQAEGAGKPPARAPGHHFCRASLAAAGKREEP